MPQAHVDVEVRDPDPAAACQDGGVLLASGGRRAHGAGCAGRGGRGDLLIRGAAGFSA